MVLFICLVPKRRHISDKFYQRSFVHCINTGITCKLYQVSRQTVSLKETYFVGRQLTLRIAFTVATTIKLLIFTSVSGVCLDSCDESVLAPI